MSIDCDVQKLASVANKEYTPGDKEDAVNEFNTIEEPFSNQEVVKPPIPPVLVTFIEPSSEFKQLEFSTLSKERTISFGSVSWIIVS